MTFDERRIELMNTYFRYTRERFPSIASERDWLAVEEAHFQRIILDNVCGGVWYGHLKEPAVLHLSKSQLKKAVHLCEALDQGYITFDELNDRSLAWREAAGAPPDFKSYRRN